MKWNTKKTPKKTQKKTKTLIILNTMARTGSYFAHNIIMDNLVKQDESWKPLWGNCYMQVYGLMNNLDTPDCYTHIKNPIEPFAGLSLDHYGTEHPFGSNYEDISEELKTNKLPFTISNIWNEKEYAHVSELKNEGWEVISLYRKDKLKWFMSTALCVAINDVNMFHAHNKESADYISNKRKTLVGNFDKFAHDFFPIWFDSLVRYNNNCEETTDKWISYEELAEDSHSIVRLSDKLDDSLDPLERPVMRKIPHPVDNMWDYFEKPDDFKEIWDRFF